MSIEVWQALGALSPEERTDLASVFREAWETTLEFEPTDLADWSFLLFAAQELGFAREAKRESATP